MEAWGRTRGEGLHTQTFLGNPFGCAMALETLRVLDEEDLIARSASLGAGLLQTLRDELDGHPRVAAVRGRGLLVGVELRTEDGEVWAGGGVAAMHALLRDGVIVAPAGARGEVVALTPPFVVTEAQITFATERLIAWVRSL
jgi:4-aminobutyrate aminotransferase-like enzyme